MKDQGLFSGAKFGQMFVCRNGQKALFLSFVEDDCVSLCLDNDTIHYYGYSGIDVSENEENCPYDIVRRAVYADGLQIFRNSEGYIICVKFGWVAVDIPAWNCVTDAECRGTSSFGEFSYYDIALNGEVVLHIYRSNHTHGGLMPGDFRPYFFEKYPL